MTGSRRGVSSRMAGDPSAMRAPTRRFRLFFRFRPPRDLGAARPTKAGAERWILRMHRQREFAGLCAAERKSVSRPVIRAGSTLLALLVAEVLSHRRWGFYRNEPCAEGENRSWHPKEPAAP